MRCLIVDDSAPFRAAASAMLERAGITVEIASTSADAVRCHRQHPADVTLVDVHLGTESGFELAEELHRLVPPATVILISTHTEQDLADLVEASPAIGFLPKIALSADAIRDLLGSSGQTG
jgi:DNA-binding NtrC family response regulator